MKVEYIKPVSDRICSNCASVQVCNFMEKSRYYPGTCPKFIKPKPKRKMKKRNTKRRKK